MHTSSAQATVPAEPAAVFAAALGLVRREWSVTDADVVESRPPHRLVHAVRLDGDIACWLTWEFAALPGGHTAVRLVHDELYSRSVPPPELDSVLVMLRVNVPATGGATCR
jgi:hypothetical protein